MNAIGKVHLTLCGFEAGRPLCDINRERASAAGHTFEHAAYSTRSDNPERYREVCPACLAAWHSTAPGVAADPEREEQAQEGAEILGRIFCAMFDDDRAEFMAAGLALVAHARAGKALPPLVHLGETKREYENTPIPRCLVTSSRWAILDDATTEGAPFTLVEYEPSGPAAGNRIGEWIFPTP